MKLPLGSQIPLLWRAWIDLSWTGYLQSKIFSKEVRDFSPIRTRANDAYAAISKKYKVKTIPEDLEANLEDFPQFSQVSENGSKS